MKDLVTTNGIVGHTLSKLVKEVEQSITRNIKMNLKINSAKWTQTWSNFPQNIPSYFPIIRHVTRLGNVCVLELISTIIEADKEFRLTKDIKKFKFTTLREHIIKQFGKKELNTQICNYAIDFMMVDVLITIMEHTKPSELYSYPGKYLHIELTNKCVQKLQLLQNGALGNELSARWSVKRLRKWSSLISVLSPTYPENIVDNFKLLYNAYPTARDNLLFGASYIKFHCTDVYSVPFMHDYFDWIHSLIINNKENAQRLKLIMLTLEHNIRLLNVTSCILNPIFIMKIQNNCFVELHKIFSTKENRVKFRSREILHSPFRRLRSSLLLKLCDNWSDNITNWLSCLVDFHFSNRKHINRLSDVLHFLRSGGSCRDNVSTNQDIMLQQAYGRIESRLKLDSKLCKIVCDKLFKPMRKYYHTKQAVQIFMLSSCAIQLCLHNFQYTINNIICPFMAIDINMSIERLFIAIQALNFICIPQCKFVECMEHIYKDQYSNQQRSSLVIETTNISWTETLADFNLEKRQLSSLLRNVFCYIGKKTVQIKKHILSITDARETIIAHAFETQDTKIMFEEYVHQMLLFDWTDKPEHEYIHPINNIENTLLIYCLRVLPHIEYEKLWCTSKDRFEMNYIISYWIRHCGANTPIHIGFDVMSLIFNKYLCRKEVYQLWDATANNCSSGGIFIGRWLLHKDEKVRYQTLRSIIFSMKDLFTAATIMNCFVEMLSHHDWQIPACLIMLLKTVIYLLDHYKKLVILDQEFKIRHNMANMNNDGKQLINEEKQEDSLRKCKELPPWLSWQNKADALGLVLLCYYHVQVRMHAAEFLNKIHDIYKEFNDVESSKRTVGGLIIKHGRSIARNALIKYEEENSQNLDNINTTPSIHKYDFSQCIHPWGLIPFSISQLATAVCGSHLHETILNVADIL
eukprot:275731_1